MKKILFLLVCLSLATISCSDDGSDIDEGSSTDTGNTTAQDYILPSITSYGAQSVSLDKARISALVEAAPLDIQDQQNDRSNTITSKGFVYGTNENPNIENSTKLDLDNEFGFYSDVIDNLSPNVTYYFAPYASNANNETKYGVVNSFTTASETPCTYEREDYLSEVYELYEPITISDVTLSIPSGFNDGNLEFEATTSSIVRILINLNEIDLPLSGKYNAVYDFDVITNNYAINLGRSTNQMKLSIKDYNGFTDFYPQGASNDINSEFYIENNGTTITFIFCDTEVGAYNLNGKFSYEIP